MIKLNFEQKQKVLLMLLKQIKNEMIYSELKNLISSAINIDVLNYLREIIAIQIEIEKQQNVNQEDVRRVVLLANEKTNYIDKITEIILFSEILKGLQVKEFGRKLKL